MITDDIAEAIDAVRDEYGRDLNWQYQVIIQAHVVGMAKTPQGPVPMQELQALLYTMCPSGIVNEWVSSVWQCDPWDMLSPDGLKEALITSMQNLRNMRAQALSATNGHPK